MSGDDLEMLAALDESIEHWNRHAEGSAPAGEGIGAADCALCALYFCELCTGCPIREKTGMRACGGGPYPRAHAAARDFGMDSPEFREAAREMLEYLRALRLEHTPDDELDQLLEAGARVEFHHEVPR